MKKSFLLVLGLICGCIFTLFFINRNCVPVGKIVVDTVYIEKIVVDTVPKLVLKEIKEIVVDTVYSIDSVLVPVFIPIESKIYKNELDSVSYTAYISGYKANLDSIDIRVKYPTITKTITQYIQPNYTFFDRFKIGINVSAGYGLFNKKIDIYTGIGISYDF
jgi:hypothetical protein